MPGALPAPRPLGRSGLRVPPLGLGAAALGDPALTEAEAERLLLGSLDLGLTLVDTARSYGLSEERIGRILPPERRRDVVLSTKVGYGVEGLPDWTGACVAAGVDRALRLLRTDVLDIVHLHSCPLETLRREDVGRALEEAVRAGKVRVAAYSGEGEALEEAIACGRFGSLQLSVSLCDQGSLAGVVPLAEESGLGVLAKRALANAPWSSTPPPSGDSAAAAYRERWQAMRLGEVLSEPAEAAIRFVAFAPGVSSALVGSRRLEHLEAVARAVGKGPLPEELAAEVRARFRSADRGWTGQI